jgi:hypothetical protein
MLTIITQRFADGHSTSNLTSATKFSVDTILDHYLLSEFGYFDIPHLGRIELSVWEGSW